MSAETLRFTNIDAKAYATSSPFAGHEFTTKFENPLLALQAQLMEKYAEIDYVNPEVLPATPTLQRRIGYSAVTGFEGTFQELLGAQPTPRESLFVASNVGHVALAEQYTKAA